MEKVKCFYPDKGVAEAKVGSGEQEDSSSESAEPSPERTKKRKPRTRGKKRPHPKGTSIDRPILYCLNMQLNGSIV